jgi:hypothetical protein
MAVDRVAIAWKRESHHALPIHHVLDVIKRLRCNALASDQKKIARLKENMCARLQAIATPAQAAEEVRAFAAGVLRHLRHGEKKTLTAFDRAYTASQTCASNSPADAWALYNFMTRFADEETPVLPRDALERYVRDLSCVLAYLNKFHVQRCGLACIEETLEKIARRCVARRRWARLKHFVQYELSGFNARIQARADLWLLEHGLAEWISAKRERRHK